MALSGDSSDLNTSILNASIEQKAAVGKSEILTAAEGIKEWMIDIRRQIQENSKVGDHCYQTCELVKASLKDLQVYVYDDKTYPTTCVVARIGSGSAPCVALRATMDAEPLQEVYEWEHKSKVDGVMHTSGHDAQTAMLLGAAKLLQERLRIGDLEGTVFLLFQPSKERDAGGAMTATDEVLKASQVIFGLHVTDELPAGTYAISEGAGPLLGGHHFVELNPYQRQVPATVSVDKNSAGMFPDPRGDETKDEGIQTQVIKYQSTSIDPKYPPVVNMNEVFEALRGLAPDVGNWFPPPYLRKNAKPNDNITFVDSLPGFNFSMACATPSEGTYKAWSVVDEPMGAAILTTAAIKYITSYLYKETT